MRRPLRRSTDTDSTEARSLIVCPSAVPLVQRRFLTTALRANARLPEYCLRLNLGGAYE